MPASPPIGHKRVWAQYVLFGHKRVGAQKYLGTKISGHKNIWAQTCLGTNMSSQSRGHNYVWAQKWRNHQEAVYYFKPSSVCESHESCIKRNTKMRRSICLEKVVCKPLCRGIVSFQRTFPYKRKKYSGRHETKCEGKHFPAWVKWLPVLQSLPHLNNSKSFFTCLPCYLLPQNVIYFVQLSVQEKKNIHICARLTSSNCSILTLYFLTCRIRFAWPTFRIWNTKE